MAIGGWQGPVRPMGEEVGTATWLDKVPREPPLRCNPPSGRREAEEMY
ncbi:MAG: hypothetical protein OXF02_01250 [Simkaniaceae bacterium]|nr:hypothetical protein [Simkaniaceae bacterium]